MKSDGMTWPRLKAMRTPSAEMLRMVQGKEKRPWLWTTMPPNSARRRLVGRRSAAGGLWTGSCWNIMPSLVQGECRVMGRKRASKPWVSVPACPVSGRNPQCLFCLEPPLPGEAIHPGHARHFLARRVAAIDDLHQPGEGKVGMGAVLQGHRISRAQCARLQHAVVPARAQVLHHGPHHVRIVE